MSPRIEGDFSKISSSFEPFPDGEFRFRVDDVVMGETQQSKLPQVQIKSVCIDPQHPELEGKPFTEFVVLKTKDGKPNTVGMGRVKAYAEAILGEEAANNPNGIDTDEFKGGEVILSLKTRSYVPDGAAPGTEPRISNEVKKVLRVD